MDKDLEKQVMSLMGSRGGKKAAEGMTKAQRTARAKKAAAASAKVRSEKKAKKKGREPR